MKEPKDLGVKVGTEEEVLWTKVRDESTDLIRQNKNNMIIQEAILKLAEKKISQEKQKLK